MHQEVLNDLIGAVNGSRTSTQEEVEEFADEMGRISDLAGTCPNFLKSLTAILLAWENRKKDAVHRGHPMLALAAQIGGAMFTIGFKAGRLSKEREEDNETHIEAG